MSKQTDLLNLTDGISVDASGNVGIGTSSPDELLEVSANTGAAIKITSTAIDLATGEIIGSIKFESNDSSGTPPHTSAQIDAIAEDDFGRGAMVFSTGRNLDFQEAMRIDSSGNVLVGMTTANAYALTSGGGMHFNPNSDSTIARSGAGAALIINKSDSDGTAIQFRKSGTTVGSIGTLSSAPFFVSTIRGIRVTNGEVLPCTSAGFTSDNTMDLGSITGRYDDIYATNGTIQTSDRNEKEAIASLTPTEMLVAARLSSSFKNFKWKDAVAEKGDAARMHSGIIAQDVQDAFAAEGLDASDYAMFISGTWWEHEGTTYDTLEEAPEGATERTRLGIRYPELLAFVAAYNDQRFLTIEARLTALEAT